MASDQSVEEEEISMIVREPQFVSFMDTDFGRMPLPLDDGVQIDYDCRNPDFILFTNRSIRLSIESSANFKAAVLTEPPAIYPDTYSWIVNNFHHFDVVFTYVRELLEIDHRFRFYPHGWCTIPRGEHRVYEKSRMVSIIASEKRMTESQMLRHEVIARFRDRLDGVFGRGYAPAESKLGFLAPFRYAVIIENSIIDAYFTEKILDAMACGTVPIYRGCPSIGEFVDIRGVIQWVEIEELESILDSLSEEDYESRLPAIRANISAAAEYGEFGRNLWRHGLRDMWYLTDGGRVPLPPGAHLRH